MKERKKNKEKRKWRGAISYCRKLADQAVICLFADGTWRASATGDHTHNNEYLHFRRGELKGDKIPLIEKYFQLLEEGLGYGHDVYEILHEIYSRD